MTSPQSIDYPRPADWQQFERLCRALLCEVHGARFQRWGRGGQRQNGLDAVCMDADGIAVGLQCKGRSQGLGRKLSKRDIIDTLKAIETLPFELDELVILTTASDEVSLHEFAVELTNERKTQGKCKVEVWGWERISDHIGVHEAIQRAFYPFLFRQLSLRQWSLRTLIGALVIVAGAAAFHEIRDRVEMRALRTSESVHDLQKFVQLTDDLMKSYSACHGMLTDRLFAFSAHQKRFCIEPVAAKLDEIEKQIEKVSAHLSSSAWSEINGLHQLMVEDYRQSLIALEMTRHFEDEVIAELSQLCRESAGRTGEQRQETYQAGRNAMLDQLRFYFVLRDFILPGLASMKARALVHARNLAGESIPPDLARNANRLTTILRERTAYKVPALQQPFTISKVKSMTWRSINTPTDTENSPVEQARWEEVRLTSVSQVFHGRPDDIERLIACGVFKPEARRLEDVFSLPAP